MRIEKISLIIAAFANIFLGASKALAADGDVDVTFGINGEVRTTLSGLSNGAESYNHGGADIAIANVPGIGERIFVTVPVGGTGGSCSKSHPCDFAVLRYDLDGIMDTTFGNNGIVMVDLFHGTNDVPNAIAIYPNGKILVAGYTETTFISRSSNRDFALLRLLPNGTRDSSFGSNGTVRTDFSGLDDEAYDVVIQGDGRIIAVGSTTSNGNIRFGIVRYERSGSLDQNFDSGGTKTIGWGYGYNIAYSVAIQADDKIV
ncbi:MAG TPA: hypothetical protein VGQ55_17145, partial [Pyrinomonadaceae bacterium]|nr:hypothetical protein [Pyrinomonadaceae bacterium]